MNEERLRGDSCRETAAGPPGNGDAGVHGHGFSSRPLAVGASHRSVGFGFGTHPTLRNVAQSRTRAEVSAERAEVGRLFLERAAAFIGELAADAEVPILQVRAK